MNYGPNLQNTCISSQRKHTKKLPVKWTSRGWKYNLVQKYISACRDMEFNTRWLGELYSLTYLVHNLDKKWKKAYNIYICTCVRVYAHATERITTLNITLTPFQNFKHEKESKQEKWGTFSIAQENSVLLNRLMSAPEITYWPNYLYFQVWGYVSSTIFHLVKLCHSIWDLK